MNELLRIDAVSRHFGGIRALDSVSFMVERGTICGLIGPNGAGKTTLINLVSGLLPLTSGLIALGDRTLNGLPPHLIAVAGIGRTFQNIRLFVDLSVLDNVAVGYHLRRRSGLLATVFRLPAGLRAEREARERAREMLDRVGIGSLALSPAGALSYGDQRRVEIARSLVHQPSLLLLDEPTAGMNPAETDLMARLFLDLRAQGTTLLVIEHDLDLIMRVSDRLVVLNFGRKIADGLPAAVRQDPAVLEAYLGEDA